MTASLPLLTQVVPKVAAQVQRSQVQQSHDELTQPSKQLPSSTKPLQLPSSTKPLRYICKTCFASYPHKADLMSKRCLCPQEHKTAVELSVLWSQQKCKWIHVRPVPKVTIPGRFILCNEWRCRGQNCTYAHNEEERKYWNSVLQERRLMRKGPGNVIWTLLVIAFGGKETLSSLSILHLYLCNTVYNGLG